ncbi:hypothetical protein GF359_10050 [candidate division WOR-3 bacterium]|uniref:Porin n=1 Tax=candidate division WOR-3 bacterium TaxID=2052148 RepID=A0A9D5KAZ3_UNCW3|nr:hypothetical protein [candidate division WOR-3 bacterium]MBD3365543.1 hypothetical protein [candidate division WOR-3 bacterium]
MSRVKKTLVLLLALCVFTPGWAQKKAQIKKALADNVNFAGYVQVRWEGTLADELSHSFGIRRAYLGAGGKVTDWLGYRVLLTFPGASVSLYDACIDITPVKFAGLRVGQFLTPFGFEKQHSSSVILFPERTYASGHPGYFPIMDRDIGAMLYGTGKFFDVKVGMFNGRGRNLADDNNAKDLVGNLNFKFRDLFHVGGSYTMGTRTPDDTLLSEWDFNRWGAEMTLTPLDLWFAAEFMGGADDEVSLMTYYAEAGWTFKLDTRCLCGIQPAVRYESVDPDTDTDDDSESILTGGINLHFLPKHKAKLALCYRMIMEETASVDNDQAIAQLQVKFP